MSSSTGESKSASLEKKSGCRPPVKPQNSPSWIYLVNPFLTIAYDFHNHLISFVSVIDQALFWLHSSQLAASLFQSHFVQTSSDFGLFRTSMQWSKDAVADVTEILDTELSTIRKSEGLQSED